MSKPHSRAAGPETRRANPQSGAALSEAVLIQAFGAGNGVAAHFTAANSTFSRHAFTSYGFTTPARSWKVAAVPQATP